MPKKNLPLRWPITAAQDNEMRTVAPSHTLRVFDYNDFPLLVRSVAKLMWDIHKVTPFTAIAGCGHSGVPIISALSFKLQIPMMVVRKTRLQTEADERWVNGSCPSRKYLIIDDLISTGRTINHIVDKSKTFGDPVGILLYKDTGGKTFSGHSGNIPVHYLP